MQAEDEKVVQEEPLASEGWIPKLEKKEGMRAGKEASGHAMQRGAFAFSFLPLLSICPFLLQLFFLKVVSNLFISPPSLMIVYSHQSSFIFAFMICSVYSRLLVFLSGDLMFCVLLFVVSILTLYLQSRLSFFRHFIFCRV
jgi:hypothetical protein